MNELQIALVIIGIVAVVAIVVYNRWQEHRFRKQAEAGFDMLERDPLLDDTRGQGSSWADNEPVFDEADAMLDGNHPAREPTFDSDQAVAGAATPAAVRPASPEPDMPVAGRPEPVVKAAATVPAPAVQAVATVAVKEAAVEREEPHSDLIEFKVKIKNLEGMLSDSFTEVLLRCRALGKPVRWRALPIGALDWEVLQPQSRKKYLEVVASMQLADRKGPATREELTSLCNLAQDLALSKGWQSRCDDVVEAMVKAQSLDRFCADVDVLIGLNIVSRGVGMLPIARIRAEAEAAGMQLQSDGAYHLLDSRKESLFTLSNRESQPFPAEASTQMDTKGVTLLFDVPRVPDGLKTFDNMVNLGRKLVQVSGGQLVDDDQRQLTDAGIEKIRSTLVQLYSKMEARGIAPGGRLALRLFA